MKTPDKSLLFFCQSKLIKLNLDRESDKKLLIVIAGPTASGKTSMSINVAKSFDADIISADSRQVYKEMNIGTAKPDALEMEGVNHHFIGNVSIFDKYNVGKYEKEVMDFLNGYFLSNDYVILTGGTGLYIDAIINGIDEFPEIDVEIVDRLKRNFKQNGIGYLQDELRKADPMYFQTVDLNNSHRLIRALSVIKQCGKPFTSFTNKKNNKREFDVVKVLLEWPRAILYERINRRVDQMMVAGLEEEARNLLDYRYLKALQTVGYKELFEYFDGEISKNEAVELIKRNTRRYAKRQLTWFRNKGEWKYFNAQDFDGILNYILLK